jgi:hypothetical protein
MIILSAESLSCEADFLEKLNWKSPILIQQRIINNLNYLV